MRGFDASGLMVLPGIVDIHGDAFERQMQPRPGIEQRRRFMVPPVPCVFMREVRYRFSARAL